MPRPPSTARAGRVLLGVLALMNTVADGKSKPGLKVVNRLGPNTATAPGNFSTAVEDVVSGPTASGRGWMVDGFNSSTTTSYNHEASVVCVKGNKKLKLRKASVDVAKARRDYLATHRR